jgi:hypothetical protein
MGKDTDNATSYFAVEEVRDIRQSLATHGKLESVTPTSLSLRGGRSIAGIGPSPGRKPSC